MSDLTKVMIVGSGLTDFQMVANNERHKQLFTSDLDYFKNFLFCVSSYSFQH